MLCFSFDVVIRTLPRVSLLILCKKFIHATEFLQENHIKFKERQRRLSLG